VTTSPLRLSAVLGDRKDTSMQRRNSGRYRRGCHHDPRERHREAYLNYHPGLEQLRFPRWRFLPISECDMSIMLKSHLQGTHDEAAGDHTSDTNDNVNDAPAKE
jgi:hypothetical protein